MAVGWPVRRARRTACSTPIRPLVVLEEKMRRRTALLIVALTIGLGATGTVGSAATADPGEVLRESVLAAQSAGQLHGVIGLVRDGDSVGYASAGLGDVIRRTPADPHARFRIGSNTKAFVSTVLLQLEAEGALSLDDTVDHWLPGVVDRNGNDGTTITVRQLLNHTSGIPEYMTGATLLEYGANLTPAKPWTPRQLVDIATASQPTFAPGTAWGYSNTNYALAGMVITAVTGNQPADEVTARIIEPLGLRDTTYVTEPGLDTSFRGYHDIVGLPRDVTVSNVTMTGAAGAIVSTSDDLATFARALITGDLLPPAQQRELETTVPTAPDGTGYDYGLGIGLVRTPCGPAWTHTGGTLGYLSTWASNDDGSREVVVAGNEYPASGTAATELSTVITNTLCA
jgi:D-alanyl-D-alanine carboxypeptidase